MSRDSGSQRDFPGEDARLRVASVKKCCGEILRGKTTRGALSVNIKYAITFSSSLSIPPSPFTADDLFLRFATRFANGQRSFVRKSSCGGEEGVKSGEKECRVVKIGELSTGRNLKCPQGGAKIWGINTDRDIK